MNIKRNLSPRITLNGNLHSITISKDVIRLLGGPLHVCVLKSVDGLSLAVQPCNQNDALSFKVPDLESWTRNKHFRIYSGEFVHEFLTHNGCGESDTLIILGKYDPRRNAVIFQNNPENNPI